MTNQINLDQFLTQQNNRAQRHQHAAPSRYTIVEPKPAAQSAPTVPKPSFPADPYQPIPPPPMPRQTEWDHRSQATPPVDWGRWTLPIVTFRTGLFEKLWGSGDYANFGLLLDAWCDVVPGMAGKAEVISDYYGQHIAHLMHEANVRGKPGYLTTLGVIPMSRRVELVQRGTSTVTVYLGQQGHDLFLSWQVFVQGRFSYLRALLVFLVSVTLSPLLLAAAFFFFPTLLIRLFPTLYFARNLDVSVLLLALVYGWGLSLLVVLPPIWIRGIIKSADMWAFFRNAVYPLQVDDAAALGGSVYYALLLAVEQAGIDITKLQPRLPQYIRAVKRI